MVILILQKEHRLGVVVPNAHALHDHHGGGDRLQQGKGHPPERGKFGAAVDHGRLLYRLVHRADKALIEENRERKALARKKEHHRPVRIDAVNFPHNNV